MDLSETKRCAGCRLSVQFKDYQFSDREKGDLEILGITSTDRCQAFKVAHILGIHFRSGEWGSRRCGSVITTIYAGISRYCVVNTFMKVEDRCFACVTWLSKPTYPCAPFKIVVKVKMLEVQTVHRSVIPVEKIDPCNVAVLPHIDGVHFFMLRDKGYDRTLQCSFI